MPPWCPSCGADTKPKPPVSATDHGETAPAGDEAPAQENRTESITPSPMIEEPEQEVDQDAPRPSGLPLPAKFGFAGGILLGVMSLTIAPELFPAEPGEFSIEQATASGVAGGVGAILGWILGKLIEDKRR